MDSPLLAQPWTPPEMDVEAEPHSDYFSDPFRPSPSYAHAENRWDRVPSLPETVVHRHQRYDTPADLDDHLRPKPVQRLTDPVPHTPKRALDYSGPHDGALRYPYTPDSSRILRRSTELPSSPPSWDQYSEHSSSPVQNALSSCLAHFENLIQSQQPDEDQMEYIVGQFEAMTSFLSAPDSQTKKTDEHLFSETDCLPGAGLGITSDDDMQSSEGGYVSKAAHDAYAAEVGRYIEGVKKYIEDLKMRLDEVKTLNSIQLDVIEDLRRQMRSVRQGMRSSLDMSDDVKLVEEELAMLAGCEKSEDRKDSVVPAKEFGLDSWETLVDGDHEIERAPAEQKQEEEAPAPCKVEAPTPRYRHITIIRKPERRSFWASIGEALDAFGDIIREE